MDRLLITQIMPRHCVDHNGLHATMQTTTVCLGQHAVTEYAEFANSVSSCTLEDLSLYCMNKGRQTITVTQHAEIGTCQGPKDGLTAAPLNALSAQWDCHLGLARMGDCN